MNTSIGNTSVGEKEYTLYGKSTITEILRGLTFQISANSFFQTNTRQVFGKEMASTLISSVYTSKPCLFFLLFKNLVLNTNSWTLQADVLYKLIEDCAFLKGDGSEIVLDLFCGTGTIGLTLAKRYIGFLPWAASSRFCWSDIYFYFNLQGEACLWFWSSSSSCIRCTSKCHSKFHQ